MRQSTDPLPTDTATLQALLLEARAERDAVVAERDHLQSQNVRLQHLLRQLQRAQFGPRSEKLDPDQLHLAFEDIEQAIAATEADDDKRDPVRARARAEKRRLNRGALPAHLPRVHMTIKPDDGEVSGACQNLYDGLAAKGIDVLHDDRDLRPGAKFADMDLIGLPWQVIVGPKGVSAGKAEVKDRKTGKREELPFDQVVQRFG